MKEKISIIVPIYNVEHYLQKCLDSILNQTYSNLEIILVDDGSSDKSGSICDEYALKEKRIKVIHKQNGGVSDARNTGIKSATGELIGFVDPDDFISPIMYESLYKMLTDNDADISECQARLFKEGESCVFDTSSNQIIEMNSSEALKELLKGDTVTDFVWNKLYKKELFQDIEYPIGKKFEDIGTTYKLIEKANKIVYSNNKLYGYLIRNNSITNHFNKDNIMDYECMINQRYQELITKYPELESNLNANKVVSIVRHFQNISMFSRKELLKDNFLNSILNDNRKLLKKINTKEVQQINNHQVNILATLLNINVNLFYKITRIYYQFIKR